MGKVNQFIDDGIAKYYSGEAASALKDGRTLGDTRQLVQTAILRQAERRDHCLADCMSASEKNAYSISRAVRYLISRHPAEKPSSEPENCLELEVSRHISKVTGKNTSGLFIPSSLHTRSGLDTKTGASGAYAVETDIGDLITYLRAQTKVIQLGATVLSGLDSNVAFPVQATATVASWVSQNPGTDVGESDSSFGQRTLSPKILMASTSYSRQLLAQSSFDVEAWLRKDLAAAHALALDAAAVNGSGLSNQPTGLLQTSGVGSVVGGTNGATISYALMASLMDSVFSANGNIKNDGLGFLASTDIRNKLSRIGVLDSSTAGEAVWDGDTAASWPAQASKNVPNNLTKGNQIGVANAVIFGYWPSLIIGEWGVLEILVDPYKLKKQGMVEITSFMLADILVAQPASFAVMKDALVA